MTTHYRDLNDPRQRHDAISVHVPNATPTFDARMNTNAYRSGFKRAFDVLAILLSLPVILPVIAILALVVARDGGSPFYTQQRVGRGGRIYKIWKLRTMIHNADEHLEAYLSSNPEARAEWDSTQKLKTDPRITRFGRILRKCSLDELPQLWNVVTGDMSLVGPRPMMPEQQVLYPSKAYYEMRPGITGLWQISERNETTFADRARFDVRYNTEMSFRTDLKILLETVSVVFRGTGY